MKPPLARDTQSLQARAGDRPDVRQPDHGLAWSGHKEFQAMPRRGGVSQTCEAGRLPNIGEWSKSRDYSVFVMSGLDTGIHSPRFEAKRAAVSRGDLGKLV